MIFQIDYRSDGKYDEYFETNKTFTSRMNYMLFDDRKIYEFLTQYGYYETFRDVEVESMYKWAETAIKCDLLRLMILYELGGIYIDADVIFKDSIVDMENELSCIYGNRNIILYNRSLYFIKGISKSKYLKYLLGIYTSSDGLKVDVRMFLRHKLVEFHKEIFVMPNENMEKYFNHDQVTTGYRMCMEKFE